jgi:hypothetical protein
MCSVSSAMAETQIRAAAEAFTDVQPLFRE